MYMYRPPWRTENKPIYAGVVLKMLRDTRGVISMVMIKKYTVAFSISS